MGSLSLPDRLGGGLQGLKKDYEREKDANKLKDTLAPSKKTGDSEHFKLKGSADSVTQDAHHPEGEDRQKEDREETKQLDKDGC